ncbi:MAG: hypothetical protein SVG88_07365 [Halobacteriales archaeon]|nr:hypothetical protein [Halobacteriales archaeon]
MAVDIPSVLKRGYETTLSPNGVVFVGVFYLLALLSGAITIGPTRDVMAPDGAGPPGMGGMPFAGAGMRPFAPSLGLSPIVAAGLSVVLSIVSIVVTIGALRTFVTDPFGDLSGTVFSRNILWAAINMIVGGIVFGIVVAIGLVLLIVPGLFLLVSLFFWNVFVVVEDTSFIEGFRRSWELTAGNRLSLFGVGIIVALIGLFVSIVLGLPGLFLPDIVGFLLAQLGSAVVSVFTFATVAAAYNALDGGTASRL